MENNANEIKSIVLSIELIQNRIQRIKEITNNKEKIIKIDKNIYFESLKLNLIEIGEECKNINDILFKIEGKWNDIISREYNLRISLTHYYSNVTNEIIEKHLNSRFDNFIMEINLLKIKYGGEK